MSHHIQGARVVEVPLSNFSRARNGMELLPEAENLAVLATLQAQTQRERAHRTKPAAPPAPATRDIAADPEIAKTVARITGALERDSAATAKPRRREIGGAAEAAARAERAAIVEEAAALSSGPPVEDENTVVLDAMRQFIASDLELLGRTVTATEAARHVHGFAYADADAVTLEAWREIARARAIGMTMQSGTAVARVTAKRAAHAGDRAQILELRAAFPECESLVLRLAADTEVSFAAALERVQCAAHRELVLAVAGTLRAEDAKRATADAEHSKDVVRRARMLIDAAAARGELLLAAEAVAAVYAK